jgi:hypothetical protein
MPVLAKSPQTNPDRDMPGFLPVRPSFWHRWNKQTSLVVFVIGLGLMWLAVSLLLVLEIQ